MLDKFFKKIPLLHKGYSGVMGKMNLSQLWRAYLTYPLILLYFVLIAASAFGGLYLSYTIWITLIPVLIVVLISMIKTEITVLQTIHPPYSRHVLS